MILGGRKMDLRITGKRQKDGYAVQVRGDAEGDGVLYAVKVLIGVFARGLRSQGMPEKVIYEGIFAAVSDGMFGPPPGEVNEIVVDVSGLRKETEE